MSVFLKKAIKICTQKGVLLLWEVALYACAIIILCDWDARCLLLVRKICNNAFRNRTSPPSRWSSIAKLVRRRENPQDHPGADSVSGRSIRHVIGRMPTEASFSGLVNAYGFDSLRRLQGTRWGAVSCGNLNPEPAPFASTSNRFGVQSSLMDWDSRAVLRSRPAATPRRL
jgi:hypothetical protein